MISGDVDHVLCVIFVLITDIPLTTLFPNWGTILKLFFYQLSQSHYTLSQAMEFDWVAGQVSKTLRTAHASRSPNSYKSATPDWFTCFSGPTNGRTNQSVHNSQPMELGQFFFKKMIGQKSMVLFYKNQPLAFFPCWQIVCCVTQVGQVRCFGVCESFWVIPVCCAGVW